MHKTILLLCSVAVAGIADPGQLTLEQAFQLARQNSPELKAARLNTLAAEKEIAAVGLRANPVLDFEAEGIGGDYSGFSETEYTLSLSQKIQLGGKREYARNAAGKTAGIALKTEAEKELALLAEVRSAFIDVAAQQEIGNVRQEQAELGRAFLKTAQLKYANGGASELEVIEAGLALEEILLSQTCCFGDLEAARIRLASLIGISETEIGGLSADYYTLESIEPQMLADRHPSIQKKEAEIAAVHARAKQAGAEDAVDITFGAGYRYEAASDASTFVMGASIPLNFVRQGKARQAAILIQADAQTAELAELRRRYQQDLSVLIAQYNGAKMEAEIARDKLIPKAEKAYELSRAGYDAGRFSWFELIAAQQHLAEIRVRRIEALQSAHQIRAAISKYTEEGF